MNGNEREYIVGFHGFPHNEDNIMKKIIDDNFRMGGR